MVIAVDDHGYHLAEGIVIELYDEAGTLVGHCGDVVSSVAAQKADASTKPLLKFNDKQRWVLARLASEGQITRREVEREFGISDRTAKRVLGELSDAGMIEFDRETHPGCYRPKR